MCLFSSVCPLHNTWIICMTDSKPTWRLSWLRPILCRFKFSHNWVRAKRLYYLCLRGCEMQMSSLPNEGQEQLWVASRRQDCGPRGLCKTAWSKLNPSDYYFGCFQPIVTWRYEEFKTVRVVLTRSPTYDFFITRSAVFNRWWPGDIWEKKVRKKIHQSRNLCWVHVTIERNKKFMDWDVRFYHLRRSILKQRTTRLHMDNLHDRFKTNLAAFVTKAYSLPFQI